MLKAKSIQLFILSLFISSIVYSESITVSGSVGGSWDTDTVRVVDDIDIESGDSLFISAGVFIEFEGSYSFYVRGYIRAHGTYQEKIIFDVADTTGFSADTLSKGGWNGIHFYYNSYTPDSSIFEYCIFRHGKAVSPDSIETHGGAMCLRDIDRLRISDCLFEDNFAKYNGGAIYLEESDVLIKDCEFLFNRCGPLDFPWGYGGALCSDHSEVILTGCTFRNNVSTGVGGGAAIRFMDAVVSNNAFTGNYSALGGAIGFLHYYEYPNTQCNNFMADNSAEFFGGAVANLDAGPTLVNNTITGNSAMYGGAFYVKDSLVPNVYNCILWENWASDGPEVYLWDGYASANFHYCDIEGGVENFGGSGGAGYSGVYEENIDADPLFEIPGFVYYPEPGSPCHNAGTPDTSGLKLPSIDFSGGPRIDNLYGRIEMGCFELWWVNIGDEVRNEKELLEVYPNPATSLINIKLPLMNTSCMIELLNSHGQTVFRSLVPKDQNIASIDISDFSPGIFLINVEQQGGLTRAGKFIVE